MIRAMLAVVWFLAVMIIGAWLFPSKVQAHDGCYDISITPNTPTGIAGCEVWGAGIGSHYGPGSGVAMNFCTWERRHNEGCGLVTITSVESGLSVSAPVVDFCDCYTGTSDQRVVDMQYGVLDALGLDRSQGLYDVVVTRVGEPPPVATETRTMILPDTAASEYCGGFMGVFVAIVVAPAAAVIVVLIMRGIRER